MYASAPEHLEIRKETAEKEEGRIPSPMEDPAAIALIERALSGISQ